MSASFARAQLHKSSNHQAGLQGYRGGDESSSSSSSSSTSNTTQTYSETRNTDKRQVVSDFGVGVSSDSSTVNVTQNQSDFGAILGALGLSKAALESSGAAGREASQLSRDALAQAAQVAGDGLSQSVELSRTALEGANNNFELVMQGAGRMFDRILDGNAKNQQITEEVLRSYSPLDGNRAAVKDKLDAGVKIAIALGASFVVAKFVR
jgi:hypothetical protein